MGFLPLEIALLGPPKISRFGEPVRPLRTRKGYSVLAFLALRRNRIVERELLAATLWPDSAPDQSLSSLRRALTDLRDALGESEVCLTAPTLRTLRLDLPEEAVDLWHFDKLLSGTPDIPALKTAVQLYKGPFLEGNTEDWVLMERQRRAEAFGNALHTLADREQEAENTTEALLYLEHLIALHPLREETYRQKMRLLHANNNLAELRKTYHNLRLLLHREANTNPSQETITLFQKLQQMPQTTNSAELPRVGAKTVTQEIPSHLPRPFTNFIGRTKEVAELRTRLLNTQILTLTGTGGVGKTRLALRLAEESAVDFPDGVAFVDLSPVRQAERVTEAIQVALSQIRIVPGSPNIQLTDALHDKTLLLVMDNAEHLWDAVAERIDALRLTCPHLRFLVTSRRPLQLAGEVVWSVAPMSLPEEATTLPVGQLLEYDAIQLFVQRAAAQSPAFTLTAENAARIIEICRHLDGLPLPLELAAARTKALSLAEIVDHLQDRFHLLNNGPRSLPLRQRTLRALMDWSFDLLTDEERHYFVRLGIFAGPVPGSMIHAVCSEEGTAEWETLNSLADLVDKSLVVFDGTNYSLLETLRQYARERLQETPKARNIEQRYRTFFLQFAETATQHLRTADAPYWTEQFDFFHNELRAALDSCECGSSENPCETDEVALRLGAALAPYWLLRGHLAEGRERLRQLLARPTNTEAACEARLHILNNAGTFAYRQGDLVEAESLMQEKLACCQAKGEDENTAQTLGNLGNIAFYRGETDLAETYYARSLPFFTRLNNRQGMATVLMNLGNIAVERGRYSEGETLLQQSLVLWRELGNLQGTANLLHNFGIALYRQKRYEPAQTLLQESLTLRQQLHHQQGIAHTLVTMSAVARGRNALTEARTYLCEAWSLLQELGDRVGQEMVWRGAGELAEQEGRFAEAILLYSAAQARTARTMAHDNEIQSALLRLRERVDAPTYSANQAMGSTPVAEQTLCALLGDDSVVGSKELRQSARSAIS